MLLKYEENKNAEINVLSSFYAPWKQQEIISLRQTGNGAQTTPLASFPANFT